MTLLLSVTLAYTAGLLAGLRQPLPLWCLAALCTCALLVLRGPRREAAVILFIVAGLTAGSLRSNVAAHDCREQLRDGAHVRLTGVPLVVPTEGVTLPVQATTLAEGAVACAGTTVRIRASARHLAVLDSAVNRGATIIVTGRWMAYAPRNGWPRKPEFAGGV
ncbi:MAG: hypothetical protein ACRELT_10330, partial [Longimicrobiales bacterium]